MTYSLLKIIAIIFLLFPAAEAVNVSYIWSNFLLFDMPSPVSEKMNSISLLYWENMQVIFFVLVVVICVLGLALDSRVSLLSHPVKFSIEEEHFIELFVIIIPSIIVLLLVVPTLGYLMNEELTRCNQLVSFYVNITGNQWYWSYEYDIYPIDLDEVIDVYMITGDPNLMISGRCRYSFTSVHVFNNTDIRLLDVDNSLVLPVNTNILLKFTSKDVIHAWALPQMGIKVDCIPGKITETVLNSYCVGTFFGQCSELCGEYHFAMPIKVSIVPSSVFFWFLCIIHEWLYI
jgi:cytochrome c oxidase subunit II